jgi:hypothetical protein
LRQQIGQVEVSEYIAEISDSSGSDDNSDGEEAATDEPAVHSSGLSFRTSQGGNAPFTPEYEALTMQALTKTTPEVVRCVQISMIKFLENQCPGLHRSHLQNEVMSAKAMKKLRCDAAVLCEVLAVIQVAKSGAGSRLRF